MGFKSKNMNYIFNVEYFKDLEIFLETKETSQNDLKLNIIKQHNKEIENFLFLDNKVYIDNLSDVNFGEKYEYCSFVLYTQYPGLLVGIGNPHDAKLDEAIKCGFMFDYVTGIPYIPGSSLKGMLRSFFPKNNKEKDIAEEYASYIKGLLKKEDLDVSALESNIFDGNDVFLGAFPNTENIRGGIMKMDYITPHEKYKDPNPISIIKVKPNVPFIFSFLLTDYTLDGNNNIIINKNQKENLFKNIIIDMGIGAKTNVGFGKFAKSNIK